MLYYGSVSEQAPLWFILDFFFVKVISSYLLHLTKKENVLVLAFISTLFLHYFSCPPIISRLPLGVFFYSMGYILKDIQYKEFLFAFFFASYLLFELSSIHNYRLNYRLNTSPHYFLSLLFCISGIISLNNIAARIKYIRENYILQYIGKNAMTIYLLHWFYIRTMSMDWGLPISCFIRVMITLSLMMITLPLFICLFNRPKFKWIIGK